jgi:hypothetical protein
VKPAEIEGAVKMAQYWIRCPELDVEREQLRRELLTISRALVKLAADAGVGGFQGGAETERGVRGRMGTGPCSGLKRVGGNPGVAPRSVSARAGVGGFQRQNQGEAQ